MLILRLALATWEAMQDEETEVVTAIIKTFRDCVTSLPVRPHQLIEVAREQVKVIASDIRGSDFEWEETELLSEGVGQEGDILGMSGSMEHYEAWGLRSRPIYLTYSIGRNDAGSKNRIEAELNLPVFNPMKENETIEICDDLLARIEGLGAEPENTD